MHFSACLPYLGAAGGGLARARAGARAEGAAQPRAVAGAHAAAVHGRAHHFLRFRLDFEGNVSRYLFVIIGQYQE